MSVDLDRWAPDFASRLKPQLTAQFDWLVGGRAREQIVGLGAYTDADATSLVAVANTAAHLDEQRRSDPAYRNYYRWSPGEWDLNPVSLRGPRAEPDDLAAANAELERVADEVRAGAAGTDTLHDFRFMAWAAIVNALGQLLDDGYFDAFPAAVQVFAAIDVDVEVETQNEWMAEMNTDAAAAEFARWLADPSS